MSAVPRWSRSTKILVSAALLVVAGLLLYSFRTILIPIVLVLLFAYILAPLVGWLARRLHIGRSWAVMIIYLVGIGALATLPAVTVPAIMNEVDSLLRNLDAIGNRALGWLEQLDQYQIELMGYTFSLPPFEPPVLSFELDKVMGLLDSTISPLAGGAFSVVKTVASGVGWLIFMAAMGFYLLRDADRLIPAVLNVAPDAYRGEASKLIGQVNQTWNAFLRGQIVLCTIIGVLTAVAMSAVGIRFAVALGIVAGILEIIPSLGPTLAAVPAIVLALFQGSSRIPLSNVGVALVVAGVYWMIQSLENNLLVPRIIGSSLNLHPLMVIVGVLAGATLGSTLGLLGGILGALLAAPLLATLRHVLRYIYCKLADLDPFPEPPSFGSLVRQRNTQALLFDLDGTLVETDDAMVRKWAHSLEQIPLLNRLYDSTKLARRLIMALHRPANGLLTLLDVLGLDARFFAASEWLRQLEGQPKPEEFVAVDGAIALLRELHKSYRLALTTTRDRADVERFLKQFGLDGEFTVLITRDDVRRLKPHAEPVQRAAAAFGLAPAQCIMIGDTSMDIRAGQRAGALTVGVLSGFGEAYWMKRYGPDLIVGTAIELLQQLPRTEPA
jgi:HAD superfamily hydrolase (TIGR01509 family)